MGGRREWQAALKRRVSGIAHGTGRRPVLQWAYGGLIGAETAVASAWVRRRGRGPVDPGNLTLVVKTFERPAVLRRMLASIRRVFSGPVVVADDSRAPGAPHDPATRVVALPFDTGIGAGRNALLTAVGRTYETTAPEPEPWDEALVGVVSDALAGAEDPGPHWADDARRVLDALAARGYLERPKSGA